MSFHKQSTERLCLSVYALCAYLLLLTLVTTGSRQASAADWPAYRGALGNGVVEKSPPLAAQWPASGPILLWEQVHTWNWANPVAHYGFASPVVAGGRVFVYLNASSHALPAAEGVTRTAWKLKQDDRPQADVYVCFDALSGAKLWQQSFDLEPRTFNKWGQSPTPVVAGEHLIARGAKGVIRAFACDDGRVVWERKLATGGTEREAKSNENLSCSSPLVVGDVLIATAGEYWHALSLSDGTERWRLAGGSDYETPTTYVHAGRILVTCRNKHQLRLVDVETGSVVAEGDIGYKPWAYFSSPVTSAGHLYVSGAEGAGRKAALFLYRISVADTELSKNAVLPGGACNTLLLHDGRIFQSTDKGLSCFQDDGDPIWKKVSYTPHVERIKGGKRFREKWVNKILADGKVISFTGYNFHLVDADTGRMLARYSEFPDVKEGDSRSGWYASPALVDGLVYWRTYRGLRCYDLRAASYDDS